MVFVDNYSVVLPIYMLRHVRGTLGIRHDLLSTHLKFSLIRFFGVAGQAPARSDSLFILEVDPAFGQANWYYVRLELDGCRQADERNVMY